MNKKSLDRQTMVALLLGLLIVAGVALGVHFTLDALDERAALEELEWQKSTTQSQVDRLVALNAQYDDLLAEYEKALPYIPDAPCEEDIITLLETVAGAYDCTLTRLAFQDRVAQESLQQMSMTLNLSGSYVDLASFALELNDLARYIRIDSIIFSGAQSSGDMTATLEVSAFYTA